MAYKFQIGPAKLAGATTFDDNMVVSADLQVDSDLALSAGVIDNSELANNSVTINSQEIALGASHTFDSDDIGEGSSNLYFTEGRARASISVSDAGGDGSLAYDNSTGVITYTGPSAAEVRAHLSAGEMLDYAGGQFSIDSAEFSASAHAALSAGAGLVYDGSGAFEFDHSDGLGVDSNGVHVLVDDSSIEIDSTNGLQVKALGVTNAMLAGNIASTKIAELNAFDTDGLSEGASNLYFTQGRARASISGADIIDYDSSTGVIDIDAAAFTASVRLASNSGFDEDAFILDFDTSTGMLSVNAANMSSSVRTILSDSDSADEVRGHLSAGNMLDFASGEFKVVAADFTASANAAWDVKMAAADTDDLSEGASNLYFTQGRARASISVSDAGGDGSLAYDSATGVITYTGPSASEVRAHLSVTDNGGDGSLSYDSSTGVISYTGPSAAEVRAHLSAGNMLDFSGGEFSVNASDFSASADAAFDTRLATKDTDDLAEGSSNLYFTEGRARASISVSDAGGDGSLTYDSSTGVIEYTGPSAAEVRAHLSAGTGVSYNSATGQISIGQAVESSSDVQFASASLSGDLTVAGDLTVNGSLTYINTTDLEVTDNEIILNKGGTLGAGATAGIRFEDTSGDDIIFQWEGTNNQFEALDGTGDYVNIRAQKFIGVLEGSMVEDIQTVAADATASAQNGKTIILVGHNSQLNLPAASAVEGVVLKIKNYDRLASASEPAVIAAATGEQIEGNTSISLPSPGAAVMIVSDGSEWHVM